MHRFKMGLLAATVVFSLAGCAADQKIAKAEQNGEVYVGMPLRQLVQIVGHEPNEMQDRIEYEHTANGNRMIWVPGAREGNAWNTYTFVIEGQTVTSYQRR